MNQEVEIKVILKNPEQVEEKLKQIGKFIKEKGQTDEYFTPKHEDYFAIEVPIKYIRIRYEKGNNQLEFQFLHFDEKGTLLVTDEYSTKIEKPDNAMDILLKMGMTHRVTVNKIRRYFEYKDFEIMLDYIKELGYFIEVEAKKLLGTIEETKKKCYEILSEIGADYKDAPNLGYPLMIIKKQGETK